MIKFNLLSIVLCSILPNISRASQALDGTYIFRGVSCDSAVVLGREAQRINEDLRFTNNEVISTFNKGTQITKSKKFAFDRYGDDYCIATLTRTFTQTDTQIDFAAAKKELKPFGKYGDKACRNVKASDQGFEIKYKFKGDLLYLHGEPSEATKVYCKSGRFYFVFQSKPNAQFTNVVRAKINDKEKRLLAEISKKPNDLNWIRAYAIHLFREERMEEALAQAEKVKTLNPKSPFPKRIEDAVTAFKNETDEKKKVKDLNDAVLSFSIDSLNEIVKPMDESMKKIDQALARLDASLETHNKKNELTPKQREELQKTPKGRELLKSLDEMKKAISTMREDSGSMDFQKERTEKIAKYTEKYKLKERAKLQYDYSVRERSDTDTCVKKYAQDKTEALEMLAKAYRNYPNSPYVLQEHVLMLLVADRVIEAESIFRKGNSRYPNQVGLEMINEYLEKIKTTPNKQNRLEMISELNMEIRYLEMAVAQVKYNKKW